MEICLNFFWSTKKLDNLLFTKESSFVLRPAIEDEIITVFNGLQWSRCMFVCLFSLILFSLTSWTLIGRKGSGVVRYQMLSFDVARIHPMALFDFSNFDSLSSIHSPPSSILNSKFSILHPNTSNLFYLTLIPHFQLFFFHPKQKVRDIWLKKSSK